VKNPLLEKQETKSYNLKEWQRGYESQPKEYEYQIEDIEGQIPPQLEGTLFRNGPGLLEVYGTPVQHPFDGDGMITSFAFKDGKCYFRNRFIQTEGYLKEKKAGKILYRGVFGTQKPGGWLANIFNLKLKNIANTNVIYWGGKLLALWEAALPYRLNPADLETIGIDYLDGILLQGDAFAAHPRIDPSCELDKGQPCLVNFAIKPGFSTTITIYELNPEGKLLRRHDHKVPGFAFIHDFVITPNYCIFFQNPVSYNPFPFVFGIKGAGECVQFKGNQPTKIVMIPRTPFYKEVKILDTDAGFIFHHANAFEQEDKISIDSICYESLSQIEPNTSYKEVNFDALSPGQLWRFTINLKNGTVEKEMIEGRCCEFPSVHPNKVGKNYRYLFIAAGHNPSVNAPLQAILKLDLETKERQLYSFATQGYVSEPIFVPKPGGKKEDEGWVMTLVYDANCHRSDLVIFEGENFQNGPVAKLHLRQHIPYGLHGSWTKECFIS
jgi:all-trans-8'-apo-beta-carotenal 15,15'-oxygenase